MTKKTLTFLKHGDAAIDRLSASGWLRMSQLPIGVTLARTLIADGCLESIVVKSKNSKRGIRLVNQASLDKYFRSLLPQSQEAAASR